MKKYSKRAVYDFWEMCHAELWKDIKDFPGYEVSNFGNVRHVLKNGKKIILKQFLNNGTKAAKKGYLEVRLYKNGKRCDKKVHTLVLEAFDCPRPKGMECDHIDQNHFNNHIVNLRWVTHSENNRNTCRNRKVEQYDFAGSYIATYNSIAEASEAVNKENSNKYNLKTIQNGICSCCTGRYNSAYNYFWKYVE